MDHDKFGVSLEHKVMAFADDLILFASSIEDHQFGLTEIDSECIDWT